MKLFQRTRTLSRLTLALTLCLLQGCAHEAIQGGPTPQAARDPFAAQVDVLYKAAARRGLTGSFLLVRVPSGNNGISNALAAMWGMDGTPAAGQIRDMIDNGHSHFGVMGASGRMTIAAVQAALKAAGPVRHPTQIFVFAGDTNPGENVLPPDIQVHWVRADGSLWP